MSRKLTVAGGLMADCHDRAIGFFSTFLRRLVEAAGRSRRFSGLGLPGANTEIAEMDLRRSRR